MNGSPFFRVIFVKQQSWISPAIPACQKPPVAVVSAHFQQSHGDFPGLANSESVADGFLARLE